jgi:putative flippase GtrA
MSRFENALQRLASREVLTFLAVGGTGYVVDVATFNLLRSTAVLGAADPSYARVLAVAVAMVITYVGNRLFTWRAQSGGRRHREVGLFVFFNVVGLAISVAALLISHDLLGLTSRLADNISANVVGLGLATIFRFWSYKRFVFASAPPAAGCLPAPSAGPHWYGSAASLLRSGAAGSRRAARAPEMADRSA